MRALRHRQHQQVGAAPHHTAAPVHRLPSPHAQSRRAAAAAGRTLPAVRQRQPQATPKLGMAAAPADGRALAVQPLLFQGAAGGAAVPAVRREQPRCRQDGPLEPPPTHWRGVAVRPMLANSVQTSEAAAAAAAGRGRSCSGGGRGGGKRAAVATRADTRGRAAAAAAGRGFPCRQAPAPGASWQEARPGGPSRGAAAPGAARSAAAATAACSAHRSSAAAADGTAADCAAQAAALPLHEGLLLPLLLAAVGAPAAADSTLTAELAASFSALMDTLSPAEQASKVGGQWLAGWRRTRRRCLCAAPGLPAMLPRLSSQSCLLFPSHPATPVCCVPYALSGAQPAPAAAAGGLRSRGGADADCAAAGLEAAGGRRLGLGQHLNGSTPAAGAGLHVRTLAGSHQNVAPTW